MHIPLFLGDIAIYPACLGKPKASAIIPSELACEVGLHLRRKRMVFYDEPSWQKFVVHRTDKIFGFRLGLSSTLWDNLGIDCNHYSYSLLCVSPIRHYGEVRLHRTRTILWDDWKINGFNHQCGNKNMAKHTGSPIVQSIDVSRQEVTKVSTIQEEKTCAYIYIYVYCTLWYWT